MERSALILLVAMAFLVSTVSALPQEQVPASKTVTMYYFWQIGCTHCEELSPFMAKLEKNYPQLDLKRFEVSKSRENGELFDDLAKAYGKTAKTTPTIFIGDYMIEGYNGWITEDRIESALQNCTEKKCVSLQEKLGLYKAGATSSTTVPVTTNSSITMTTTSTTSTTTTSTTTSTSSSTTSTTTTASSTTTSIPPDVKKNDDAMLAGSFSVLAAFIVLLAVWRMKKR